MLTAAALLFDYRLYQLLLLNINDLCFAYLVFKLPPAALLLPGTEPGRGLLLLILEGHL